MRFSGYTQDTAIDGSMGFRSVSLPRVVMAGFAEVTSGGQWIHLSAVCTDSPIPTFKVSLGSYMIKGMIPLIGHTKSTQVRLISCEVLY